LDKNKIENSLIPIGSNGLVRVGNTINITNKILFGSIEKLFNKAFFLLNSKHLNSTNDNYCILLESDSNYRKINRFYWQAKEINNYNESIELLTQVILIKPSHYLSYELRGIAKKALKDYTGAIDDYSKAIEIDPKFSYAYNGRGNAKKDLKDYIGAIDDYSKAIEIDPKFAYAYINRGNLKGALNDYTGAMDDFSKAIEIDPKFSYGYHGRGNVKNVLKDYQGADRKSVV
jgi:tetratricopeptide (TPR) repeat protein